MGVVANGRIAVGWADDKRSNRSGKKRALTRRRLSDLMNSFLFVMLSTALYCASQCVLVVPSCRSFPD